MKNFIFSILSSIFTLFIFTSNQAVALDAKSKGKVLVIVSSENSLKLKGNKTYSTGFYLNELAVPSQKLIEAGYELVVANPKGNKPSMDIKSDDTSYFGGNKDEHEKAKAFIKNFKALHKPLKFSEVLKSDLNQYSGVFFPGGHAPMIDLMKSAELGKILLHFHRNKKPTALICHGPVSLAAATKNPEKYRSALISGNQKQIKLASMDWVYSGYNMTVFSTKEEKIAEGMLGAPVEFYPEDVLRSAGGIVSVGAEWQSNAVRDRELITAQNPASDAKLVELFLSALAEKR